MAELLHDQKSVCTKGYNVFQDQSLGVGSYGAVLKQNVMTSSVLLKSSTLLYWITTTLQQVAPQREHRLPIRRFEQECEFMSAIRTPTSSSTWACSETPTQ